MTDSDITPHLAWPPSIGPDGQFVTVDEGSPPELQQCVGVVLATRSGDLLDAPTFGRPALKFQHAGVAAEQARQACAKWEPRASETIVSRGIQAHVETDDISVGPAS